MAQKGYIVFILDNRGSENRGLEFEQTTFRQVDGIGNGWCAILVNQFLA